MSRVLGFEISKTSLRAVVVEGSVKSWRVAAFAEADIPPPTEGQDPKKAFSEAVVKFLAEKKLPRGTVVPSLEASNAIIREVALPFGNDDQLRKTVKFELESHAHNVDIEDVVADFIRVDEKEKQTYLLVLAPPKSDIKERIEALTAARVDPPSMDLDACGVLNAILSGPANGLATPFLALHVGRAVSFLYHVSGGLKLMRVLPLSSAQPEFEKAASSEVNRTLLRVSGGQDLPQVFISGDGDDLPALAAMVKRDSGVEADVIDLFPEGTDIPGADRARRAGGAALGLALKGLGIDRVGTDFRREEFTYERKADALKKAAAALLILVTAFFSLAGVKFWQDRKHFKSRHAEILAKEQDMFVTLYPAEGRPPRPLEVMRNRKTAEQESQGGGAHPIPKSALEYWAELFNLIKVQNYFTVDSMRVSAVPGSMLIKMNGKMRPEDEAERILQAVKTDKAFANAKITSNNKENTYNRYDIDIPLVSEEPK